MKNPTNPPPTIHPSGGFVKFLFIRKQKRGKSLAVLYQCCTFAHGNHQNTFIMSKDTLGYIAYQLQEKLSAPEMREMAARLLRMAEEAEQLKPYTIEELHERIAQSERDIAEGRYMDFDEFMDQLEKRLEAETDAEDTMKLDFAEAI